MSRAACTRVNELTVLVGGKYERGWEGNAFLHLIAAPVFDAIPPPPAHINLLSPLSAAQDVILQMN